MRSISLWFSVLLIAGVVFAQQSNVSNLSHVARPGESVPPSHYIAVTSFGAKGDGVTDDTAAIMQAFHSMGSHPHGRLFFPAGVYRITSTLDLDLGFAKALTADSATGGIFELAMLGALRPDGGIGAAVYVHGGYSPKLLVNVDGGGACTFDGVKCSDQALKMDQLVQPSGAIQCKDYAGTCFYAFSQGTIPGLGAIAMAAFDYVRSYNSGQLLVIDGRSTVSSTWGANGFGHIYEAFDKGSKHGSVIQYVGDLEIDHFENDSVTDTSSTLRISQSASVHLGVVSVGGSRTAANLLEVGPSVSGKISMLHVLGEAPIQWTTLNPKGLVAQNGLRVTGASSLQIAIMRAMELNGSGFVNVGATLKIGDYYANTTIHHGEIVSDTTDACCTNALTTVTDSSTRNAKLEAYVVDAAVTAGGYLRLGGDTMSDNKAGTASYDVLVESPNMPLVLQGFRETAPANPLTAGVGIARIGNFQADNATYLTGGARDTHTNAAITTLPNSLPVAKLESLGNSLTGEPSAASQVANGDRWVLANSPSVKTAIGLDANFDPWFQVSGAGKKLRFIGGSAGGAAEVASIDSTGKGVFRSGIQLSEAGSPLQFYGKGTTGRIGGGDMSSRNCASGSVTIVGARPGMKCQANTSDGTLLGPFWVECAATEPNIVTVNVCSAEGSNPPGKSYNVAVFE